jgi:arylsulfatase A-like enzyme
VALWRAVEALLASRPSDHFFLYVHIMDAHDYLREERDYADSVGLADQAVGELVSILDREGLLDDAFLLLTADHGERLDEQHAVRGTKSHHGNPSFEEVLRVPLVVVPEFFPEALPGVLRGEDLNRLIQRIAGIQDLGPHELQPGELFVSETRYQSYRMGRWKSYRPRGEALVLVDLEADPAEQRDVAAEHPEIVAAIEERLAELSTSLAAVGIERDGRTEEDERRLRSLGYVE